MTEDESFLAEHKALILKTSDTLDEWNRNTTHGRTPDVPGTVSFHERRVRSTGALVRHAIKTRDADKLRVIEKFLKDPSVTSAHIVSTTFDALQLVSEGPVSEVMTDDHIEGSKRFSRVLTLERGGVIGGAPDPKMKSLLAIYLTSGAETTSFIESSFESMYTLMDERGADSVAEWKYIMNLMRTGAPALHEGIL